MKSLMNDNELTAKKITHPLFKKKPVRNIVKCYEIGQSEPYDISHGEAALWMAVITQAMQDAISNLKNAEARFHKHEAIHWLTSNSKDFIEVCIMAGADPGYIRRMAKRRLANPISWRAEATKGPRYQELKDYKQKRKLRQRTALEMKSTATLSQPATLIHCAWA